MGQENYSAMRKAMVVSQLRTSDVSDLRVIAVMSEIAREDFVPAASRNVAYSDRGVSVGEGRSLNAPLSTGLLINVAGINKTDNVLIIGAATGYSAAVVSKLAGSVLALEHSAKLATQAKTNLTNYDNVRMEKGNLAGGFAAAAPYSVILIDGIVEHVPDVLTDQLHDDGRLVAAISDNGIARLALGRKAGGSIGYQYFADCGGCILPSFEQPKSFRF